MVKCNSCNNDIDPSAKELYCDGSPTFDCGFRICNNCASTCVDCRDVHWCSKCYETVFKYSQGDAMGRCLTCLDLYMDWLGDNQFADDDDDA